MSFERPEKFEKPSEVPREENSIEQKQSLEQQANFEGNWSEIFFDRMHNPIIREQIIALLHKEELAQAEYYRTEPFEFLFEMENGSRVLQDRQGKQVLEEYVKSFTPKNIEEIAREFDENLKKVTSVTKIEFSANQPSAEKIPIYFKDPRTSKPLTIRQKSMIEAHEKGHVLRPYHGYFFDNYFATGFDRNKISFSEEDIAVIKAIPETATIEDLGTEELKPLTREEIIDNYESYLFSGGEIAERMAQLKNYFGMKGQEQFTREHLEYARQHYLADVDFDNWMKQFFQAITPETENEFLKLINNSGI